MSFTAIPHHVRDPENLNTPNPVNDSGTPTRRCFNPLTKINSFCKSAKNELVSIPFYIWAFFIEALLVPKYRPEWGHYTNWDHHIRTPKVKEKRTRPPERRPSSWSRKSKELTTLAPGPLKPVPHDHSECAIIRINVSGQVFEPQVRTLNQFPQTLLGDTQRMTPYFDPERDEFFFDRHRSSFEAIMYYYQSRGILRRPPTVHIDTFMEEVKFYDLGAKVIAALEEHEGIAQDEEKPLPKNVLKRKLWLLFEYPESSYQARIVAYMSILVVCLSVFVFCLETMDQFKLMGPPPGGDDDDGEEGTVGSRSDENSETEDNVQMSLHNPLYFIETLCIIFFVWEYVVRLLVSPNMFTFVKDASNIIDLISILPYFISIIYDTDEMSAKRVSRNASLTFLRIIRLVRVFRIFKLSRHNRGLKILGKTLKASFRELGLLVFFLCIGVVVFSSAMYFSESWIPDSHFTSIPGGFWFALVTMTTLGYGDLVPQTTQGKIVGAMCAIAGVLTISLPVPVIVSNFNMFYRREDTTNQGNTIPEEINSHIEQCPYYPATYNAEGHPIDSSPRLDKSDSVCCKWLIGELAPDRSDTVFESLKAPIKR